MALMDDFESLLKEVVQAKRLSASKMSRLTEVALKLMEEDTQLVSILYRTHKTLSSSAKISSLYVFDALSRAAKHQANKQNLSGNINSPKGNSATFLLRVEGILEGLFRDVVTSGSVELKEKAKKVLDIWVKGCTFPLTILTRLGNIMEGKETQEPSNKLVLVTSDPRVAAQAPSTTTPTTATPATPAPPAQQPLLANPQSTLLALLAQAANAGVKQIGATSTPPPPALEPPLPQQLDTSQLTLLQQLAQTAKLGGTASNPIPVFNPVPPVASDIDHGSGFSRDEPHGSRMKDAQYDRYDSSDRRDYNSHHYDHVGNPRGGFRGGRGRGFRDRDSRPPLQRTSRGSRSRSPPSRYGARRDIKPYSPPRRPSMSTLSSRDSQSVFETQSNAGPETDEFGREIRPPQVEGNHSPVAQEVPREEPRGLVVDPYPPGQPSHVEPPLPQNTKAHGVSTTSRSTDMALGLEHFNLATFDFTSPVAWQSLGGMWQVTHGVLPSTEELMEFVMTAGAAGAAAMGAQANTTGQDWNQDEWNNDGYTFPSEPQGRAHGSVSRGGHSLQDRGSYTSYGVENHNEANSNFQRSNTSSRGGLGGRMQRVGDKWMFVKDPDSTAVSS
ncbi:hypothetical protein E1B28_007302 [Marasmius oreades]|uniref:CID domain-containing protein n=1 Tax=Marasmius oreades TaxID=181124 RepID=A0A9P7S1B1_9AGAR|nr:uncharacterized protein E1B28_007302 [Marasmius oreades]KAG7093639.1 hypothetical protein E1B28_007302 [Marasmius oreades]